MGKRMLRWFGRVVFSATLFAPIASFSVEWTPITDTTPAHFLWEGSVVSLGDHAFRYVIDRRGSGADTLLVEVRCSTGERRYTLFGVGRLRNDWEEASRSIQGEAARQELRAVCQRFDTSPGVSTEWISTGEGEDQRWIKQDSVLLDGSEIRYLATAERPVPGQSSSTYLVGARCGDRQRRSGPLDDAPLRKAFTAMSALDRASMQEVQYACDLAIKLAARSAPRQGELEAQPRSVGSETPTFRSSGSGFAVNSDVIVTNNHVVDGCRRVFAVVLGNLVPLEVIAQNKEFDLAAGKLRGVALNGLQVSVGQGILGSSVTVLGYPLSTVLGTDLKVSTGIISSNSGPTADRRLMQISAPVQPGNSGGPVLDEQGSVAGVVVSRLAERFQAQNVNFAVRVPALRSFLELNDIPYKRFRHSGTKLSPVDLTRHAGPSTFQILCS